MCLFHSCCNSTLSISQTTSIVQSINCRSSLLITVFNLMGKTCCIASGVPGRRLRGVLDRKLFWASWLPLFLLFLSFRGVPVTAPNRLPSAAAWESLHIEATYQDKTFPNQGHQKANKRDVHGPYGVQDLLHLASSFPISARPRIHGHGLAPRASEGLRLSDPLRLAGLREHGTEGEVTRRYN